MGRPLNKKYFGNRNIGTTVTTDDKIGGEGVASVTIGGTNNAYVAVPAMSFATTPKLPGGVRATGTAVMGVVGVTLVAPGTGYATNDIITLAAAAGAGIAATLTVTGQTGGVIDTVSITTTGDYTTITDVTAVGVTGPGNDDATFDLTFKVNSIAITEIGSGYTAAPVVTIAGNASGTAVLSVDTGNVGSTTNQENAIVAYAWTGAARELVDIVKQEASRRYAVRTSTLVTDEPWTVRSAILVARESQADADGNDQFNEMDITATDTAANAYWVLKLTAHKALLVRKIAGNGQFANPTTHPNGEAVEWTMNDTSGTKVYSTLPYLEAGVNVKIDNA